MPRGYRSIFFALVGLALVGAGPPKDAGKNPPDNSNAQIERSLGDIASTLKHANEPSQHDKPCPQSDDDRTSDLCAQWKAADSANSAANAAWWIGGIGALIGALTLVAAGAAAYFAKKAADYTETGANAARDAVAETKRIGEAQVRCYVGAVSAVMTCRKDGWTVQCTARNYGQSPALQVSWKPRLQIYCSGFSPRFAGHAVVHERFANAVIENDIASSTETGLGFHIIKAPLTAEERKAVQGGAELFLQIEAAIVSHDVFGNRHETQEFLATMVAKVPAIGDLINLARVSRIVIGEETL